MITASSKSALPTSLFGDGDFSFRALLLRSRGDLERDEEELDELDSLSELSEEEDEDGLRRCFRRFSPLFLLLLFLSENFKQQKGNAQSVQNNYIFIMRHFEIL
jgi:hypothetical protein